MDIVRQALSQFLPPDEAGDVSLRPLGDGHINATWLAGEGFVVQRLNPDVFKNPHAVMENMRRVCAHLAEKKGTEDFYPLELLPACDGTCFWEAPDGVLWRCTRYVKNARAFLKLKNPAQAFAAACAFGRFVWLLKDLPPPPLVETIPDFHNTPLRFKTFCAAVKADKAGRAIQAKSEIEFVMSHARLAGELLEMNFPVRTVHNDTKLSNLLFDESGQRVLCVLDLDTGRPGLVLHDFGDLARSAANTGDEDAEDLSTVRLDEALFAELAKGFVSGARDALSPEEIRHMPLAMETITYELGMRFLTDYLDGDIYFRTKRPAQNLDRARVHFKLLQCMQQSRGALERVVEGLL